MGTPGNVATDDPCGECKDGLLLLPGGARLPRGGASKFVEMLIISLPCTTKLSVDFLRSRVIITVNHIQSVCSIPIPDTSLLTILSGRKIDDISNSNIDDAQEALVLLLELLLVEYLDRQYTFFRGTPKTISVFILPRQSGFPHKSKCSFQYGFSVLLITVVVLVCSPPRVATANGSGKPGCHYQLERLKGLGVLRTEDITLV